MELNCTALQQGGSLPPLVPPDATLAKTGCCRMDLHSASHQRRPQLRAGRGRTPPGRRPPYSPDTAPSFTSGIQDGICVSPLSASERTESHILFELNYQGHARTPVRKEAGGSLGFRPCRVKWGLSWPVWRSPLRPRAWVSIRASLPSVPDWPAAGTPVCRHVWYSKWLSSPPPSLGEQRTSGVGRPPRPR